MRKWWYDYQDGGIWALVPDWGKSLGNTKINNNPALFRLLLGALIKFPQISAQAAKDFLAAEHPELNIVCKKSIERFFTRWKADNPQIWTYITHPDQWKNIYMAGIGSAFEHIDHPNQLWELDSTPGDWLLTDGRHSVVGCIDMYTRRVKLFVSKSSTSAAVKQVIRRSIIDWGIPEGMRTDNGADYVSDEIDSLMWDLEIIHEICIPFASEEKGTIERFFRTMSHGILNLLEGFIGHSVADRKAIESRKSFAQRIMKKDEVVEVQMSADDLQKKLDEWVEFYYEQSPHGGLNNKSPLEVWRAWDQPLRKLTNEHALDELMSEIGGTRTIGKKGIRYNNRFYIDPTGVMHEQVGTEVRIKLDEQDIGQIAVYTDDEFLGWAVDPEAKGISKREAAAAIKGHVKKVVSRQAAELKALAKDFKKDIVQTVIDHRKAEADNIVEMPKPATPYSTPALEEAGKARQAKSKQPVTSLTDQQRAAKAKLIKEVQSAPVVQMELSNKEKMRRWFQLDTAMKSPDGLSDDDHRFWKSFQTTAFWKGQMTMIEDFGLKVMGYADVATQA